MKHKPPENATSPIASKEQAQKTMDKLMGDFLVIDIEGQAKDSAEQFARMLVDAKRLIERMRELAVENAALKLKIYPEDTGPKTGLKDEHN